MLKISTSGSSLSPFQSLTQIVLYLPLLINYIYNNKGLPVPVSILNPKSYIITTNLGLILLSKT